MSGAGGDSKRELLARHGLERYSALLETMDHYMYEDPALYRAMLDDPPALQGQIKSWDLVLTTGARSDYARGRGWNWWMAVRELIQNALDASEETYGREGMHVDIFTDGIGLHIRNRGPRLPIVAWMFGGSTKQCWERGQFGEGLKMAAIYYAGIGRPLYIFNTSDVYKAIASPTSGVVYVLIGTAARAFEGTDAIVRDPEAIANVEMIRASIFTNISSTALSEVVWNPPECQHPEPSFAIDVPDSLYVRDIYVNRISNITGRPESPSLLGYNLWWVELDPNRTTVAATRSQEWAQSLEWNIVLTWTPAVVRILLDRLVEPISPGTYKLSDKYYEGSMWLGGTPVTPEMVKAAGEWLKQHGIEAVTPPGPNVEGLRYLAQVKSLLLVPTGFLPLFPENMKLEYLYAERHVKNALNAPKMAIPENAMTLRQRGALNAVKGYYMFLASAAGVKVMPVPAVFLVAPGGLGKGTLGMCNRADYTVMIDVDVTESLPELMGTAAHEFAHCMSATAHDVTSEFEANLTKVAGYTNKMYIEERDARLFMYASYKYGGGGRIMEYRNFSRWSQGIIDSIEPAMMGVLTAAGFSRSEQGAVLDEFFRSFYFELSGGLPSAMAVKIHYDPKLDSKPALISFDPYFGPVVSPDIMPADWEPRARAEAKRLMDIKNRLKYDLVMVLMYDPVRDEYRVMADTVDSYKRDVASG
ncbi:MAG: hypothetical protein RXP91_06420 [Nitrososphaeria archaeon]